MTRGQQIHIFLADGSVTGIRHAEVDNWAGQAVACPRNRIGELKDWKEAQRPGAYLLFGTDEASGRPAVYIGEAEHVLDRMQDHLANKEFWNEIVLFSNKDENLTKAHVRYLESKLVETAKASKRYVVLNATTPQPALLSRGDRAAMESFLDHARLLLGVLGHRVLEPVTVSVTSPIVSTTIPVPHMAPKSESVVGTKVEITTKAVHANAVLTDEGIVVLAGSQAAPKAAESMPGSYGKQRDQLIQQGILVQSGSSFGFAEDYLFSSASAAACVITGYAINGRDAWKTSDGISVGQLEQKLAPAP